MKTTCIWCENLIYRHVSDTNFVCKKCSERKSMPNIKITAEVNGKQVPLETISTETFEAIKALEKPKEIPVARVGSFADRPRLIFKPAKNIQLEVGKIYVLALECGDVSASWLTENDDSWITQYKNVRPLCNKSTSNPDCT